MNPTHHPSDARLFDYATGSLSIGHRIVIEAHIGICAECARSTRVAEAVGGTLLEAAPGATMAEDALERALARIERPTPTAPALFEAPADWITAPREVVIAARRNRRRIFPGVWLAPVTYGPGSARTYLVGLRPGLSVPHHTHRGSEVTCILKGALMDRETYRAGDFIETDESVQHQPRVTGRGECVCLISSEAPVVGLDWFGKVFLPMMGV
jgi:putative transcriptional regulator